MNPRDVFLHLGAGDPLTDEAWHALDQLTREQAHKLPKVTDDLRADLAQQVMLSLTLLRDREAVPALESDGAARAYVYRALRNKYLDHVRDSDNIEPMWHGPDGELANDGIESRLEAPAALPDDPEAEAKELFAGLDGLFEHGLTLEPSADHDVRRIGWQQIKLMALEPVDAPETLLLTGQLSAGFSKAELERKRTGMYKTHERVRRQLQAAVDDLEQRGSLASEKADELRRQIPLLKRRQNRTPPASSH